MFQHKKLIINISVIIVLVVVITAVDLPGQSLLWREWQNTGHTLIFSVLALLLLPVLQSHFTQIESQNDLHRNGNKVKAYVLTIVVLAITGIAIELVQSILGRDAEILDIVRDVAGILVSLCGYAIVDPQLKLGTNQHITKFVLATASFIIGVLALTPAATLSFEYYARYRCFPVIMNFDSDCGTYFVSTHHADLAKVTTPGGWRGQRSSHVAKITLHHAHFPGVEIVEPPPDWSHYRQLNIELFSEQLEPFLMVVRINDEKHNNELLDRFNRKIKVDPGDNKIQISLDQIKTAPKGREMNMHAIKGMIIFMAGPQQEYQFYLGPIWLD